RPGCGRREPRESGPIPGKSPMCGRHRSASIGFMATDRLSLLLYRALLLSTAAVALGLGVAAGLEAPTITPEYQLTAYWRAYGLLVFAALTGYLGATPPGAVVLWVVVVFHKAS